MRRGKTKVALGSKLASDGAVVVESNVERENHSGL